MARFEGSVSLENGKFCGSLYQEIGKEKLSQGGGRVGQTMMSLISYQGDSP